MTSPSFNINNNFFKGSYQHAWKQIIPMGLTEAEVDFIQDVGELEKDSKVLDLMCGYGRHALELARRGQKVTAVDNLLEYTEEIRNVALKEQIPVEVYQDDILHYAVKGEYNTAILMGNSFAFFKRVEAVSLLQKVAAHLKKGGVLIINSWMIAEIAMKYFREKDWHFAGDYKVVLDYRFCFYPTRIESEHTIISGNGTVEIKNAIDYIYSLAEIEDMFQVAGLHTRNLFSTPRKRIFNFGDSRIYIVAEKT